MLARAHACLAAACVLLAASPAGAALPVPTRAQAIRWVGSTVEAHARSCGYTVLKVTATPWKRGWKVATTLRFASDGHVSTALWGVFRPNPTPADPLSGEIALGCP